MQAVREPLPQAPIVATGAITPELANGWLRAGAVASQSASGRGRGRTGDRGGAPGRRDRRRGDDAGRGSDR